MTETNRIEYKQSMPKDLDMVEQLGSGVPRILRVYSKECFVFGDSFTRMVFPIEGSDETTQKTIQETAQVTVVKSSVKILKAVKDYRERSLKDVITQLEPGLFKKVTGLDVKDFELLVSLGVFNSALMNDAVYKFR